MPCVALRTQVDRRPNDDANAENEAPGPMSDVAIGAIVALIFGPSAVLLIGAIRALYRWFIAYRKLSPSRSLAQSALGPISLLFPQAHSDESKRWMRAFLVWALLFVGYASAVMLVFEVLGR